jgi:hypothetical protein
MKLTFILWLVVTAAGFAQSQANGSASTTGKCSVANTGSKNTFTINCGIDKVEGAKIVSLLNRVLATRPDSEAIMQKLDACLSQTAPRSIAPEHRQDIINALKQQPNTAPYRVEIYLINSTPESTRYAQQIFDLFVAAGWNPPAIFPMGNFGGGSGIVVQAQSETSAPGIIVQQAFNRFGITAVYETHPMPVDMVVIRVNNKPVE